MTSSNSSDKTKQDCITKYIAAIDRECYNANNTNKGGVYHDCSDKTIVELARSTPLIKSTIIKIIDSTAIDANANNAVYKKLLKTLFSLDLYPKTIAK